MSQQVYFPIFKNNIHNIIIQKVSVARTVIEKLIKVIMKRRKHLTTN